MNAGEEGEKQAPKLSVLHSTMSNLLIVLTQGLTMVAPTSRTLSFRQNLLPKRDLVAVVVTSTRARVVCSCWISHNVRSGPVVLIVLSYLCCVFVCLLTELHLTAQQSIFLVILTYTKLHIDLPHCVWW